MRTLHICRTYLQNKSTTIESLVGSGHGGTGPKCSKSLDCGLVRTRELDVKWLNAKKHGTKIGLNNRGWEDYIELDASDLQAATVSTLVRCFHCHDESIAVRFGY